MRFIYDNESFITLSKDKSFNGIFSWHAFFNKSTRSVLLFILLIRYIVWYINTTSIK